MLAAPPHPSDAAVPLQGPGRGPSDRGSSRLLPPGGTRPEKVAIMGSPRRVRSRVPGAIRRFCRNERGSATVESIIWMMAFFGLIVLMTDASLAFFGKAQAFRVLQDANRAYSVKQLADPSKTTSWILATMETLSPNATATTKADDRLVTSSIDMPARDLMLFDSLGDFTITVTSQHYVEPDSE